MNIESIGVKCDYIHADEGYDKLIKSISEYVEDGDLVVISETPISTIEGNLFDESDIQYGTIGFILAELWCKFLWGYVLGTFNYNRRTVQNLRNLPVETRNHKEFIYRRYGLKHALTPTGEAGVDLSNVPGTFVSLLPENPGESAFYIKNLIYEFCGVEADVMIIDTDGTYSFFGRLYTSIPLSVEGISNDWGFIGYLLRFFSKKVGSTPLASTRKDDVYKLIEYANVAEDCQSTYDSDYFETVYNMSTKFDVDIGEVSDKMLEEVVHVPSVIIRSKYLY